MLPSLAIGLGCRRGCPAVAIRAVIDEACTGLDLSRAGLFTLDLKQNEDGLHQAAKALGLVVSFLRTQDLEAVMDRVQYRSSRVAAATGVASVAEAAALAGAGVGGRLVVPRVAHPDATCAVAIGPGDTA